MKYKIEKNVCGSLITIFDFDLYFYDELEQHLIKIVKHQANSVTWTMDSEFKSKYYFKYKVYDSFIDIVQILPPNIAETILFNLDDFKL